jgi:hypothetical protein
LWSGYSVEAVEASRAAQRGLWTWIWDLGLRHRQHAAPRTSFSSAQLRPGVGTFIGHRWEHPWPKSETTSATTGDFAMARDNGRDRNRAANRSQFDSAGSHGSLQQRV